MAAAALAQTNELLEQILVHLPIKEIILARAVSHQWKELVETSLPLKRATFRAASAEELSTPELTNRRPIPTQIGPYFVLPASMANDRIIVNPLIPSRHAAIRQKRPFHYSWIHSEDGRPDRTQIPLRRFRLSFISESTLNAIDSSMRRDMFVTWPPTPALQLSIGTDLSAAIRAILYDRQGIRLSLIVETLKKMLRSLDEVDTSGCIFFHVEFTVGELPKNNIGTENRESRLQDHVSRLLAVIFETLAVEGTPDYRAMASPPGGKVRRR